LGRVAYSVLSLGDVEISVDDHVFHLRECKSRLLSAEGKAIVDALGDKDNDFHEIGRDYPDSFLLRLESHIISDRHLVYILPALTYGIASS
jgi:hypothetical protein